MKKIILLAAISLCAASVFAYNPPFAGESIYKYSNPQMMMGAASASGGPVFTILPASITYNPALTANEQRIVVNASYTAMFDSNKADSSDSFYGQSFQLGGVIPTKWMIFSTTLQGTFADFPRMDLGNSLILHAGVSKDVTDKLYVGANLYTGFYMGRGSDFTVGMDLGGLYFFDDIGFLKAPRLGVSLLNLGKPITGNYAVTGIHGTADGTSYPGIVTPRASFAATLFDIHDFSGGFSADLSMPSFQNLAFDCGLSFAYSDMVQINFAWDCDLRELINGGKDALNWPAVGINLRFGINSSKLAGGNEDWAKSELVPSVAWKNAYNGIQTVSGSISLYLGQEDTSAPEITLWDDDSFFDDDFMGEGYYDDFFLGEDY